MIKRAWVVASEQIYISPSGKKLMARVYVPKVGRRDISLGDASRFTTPLAMVRAKRARLNEIIRAGKPKPSSLVRFDELTKEILKLKQVKAEATWVAFEGHTRLHLIPWLNKNCSHVTSYNEATWEQYIADQLALRPDCKLFNDRKAMVTILLYANKKGIIPTRFKLRNPDRKTTAGKVYTREEMKALFNAAAETLKLQIKMGYLMGMRRIEILSLEWCDIDFKNTTLTIRAEKTKTRTSRTIGIHPQVLKDLRKRKHASGYLFPAPAKPNKHILDNKTAWQACKRKAHATGRFHDLRHTFLTNAFHAAKLPQQDICAYAGLSPIVAHKVYLHPTAENTRAVACFARMP